MCNILILFVFALLWDASVQYSQGSSSSHTSTSSFKHSCESSPSTSSSSSSSSSSSTSICGNPQPPKCGKNETYTSCVPVCPPQTCASIYTDYDCRRSPPCKSGCKCKENYLRIDDNGPCIWSEECPGAGPTCGVNEHYDKNADGSNEPQCPDNNRGSTYPDLYGCTCDHGFVRNNYGQCVKPEECPPPLICRQNEYRNECYSACEKTCKTRFRSDGRGCAAVCGLGCSCIEGYLKNNNGTCVPISDCSPPICNADEEYLTCGTACELNCGNYNKSIACTDQCVEGCFCKNNTIRKSSDDLTCVNPSKCPSELQCGENEVRNECYSPCEKTCKTRFRSDGRVCPAVCALGCSCIEGYLRNDDGKCVPEYKCSPPLCNKDEVYSTCGTACETNCNTYNNTCLFCTQQCVEGCFCKPNTIRQGPTNSGDGLRCINPNKCPPRTCSGVHEELNWCPVKCPPNNCTSIWSRYYDCSNIDTCCEPSCQCKNGYYRNCKGICLSTQQCIDTQGC